MIPINILVTGANGQLGKCFQDIEESSSEIRWVFKSSTEMDITSEVEVSNVFNNDSFDFLINCAAYTAVDKAEEEDTDRAYLVNAEAVKILAQNCKRHKTTLIHVSTDFVFDGTKKIPYEVTDEPNPINVYGKSKLKGEEYIQKSLDNYYIIRTSWVYSSYGSNFVKTMLKLGSNRKEISVVNDQIGVATYAPDLVNFIMHVIRCQDHFGIYHYCNKGQISWFDFAKAIFRITNTTIKINPVTTEGYPTSAKRPKFSVLNTSKTERIFQVSISNWDKSLKKMLTE